MESHEDQTTRPAKHTNESAPETAPEATPAVPETAALAAVPETAALAAVPVDVPPAAGIEVDASRLAAALDRLVDRGVLDGTQARAVATEFGGLPAPPRRESARRHLAEIGAYLGASFVVGATLLFLGQQWDALGRAGRFSTLAAMALILFASGIVVRLRAVRPGGRWWRPRPGDSVRRRLSSTLLTGAAAAVGFAVYVGLDSPVTEGAVANERAPFVASLAGLIVVIVGYLFARSAFGQLATAGTALAAYGSLLNMVNVTGSQAFGLGMLALGTVWVVLAWRGLVAEHRFALGIAVTLGLIGAQVVALGDGDARHYLGYALTALVAGLCFTAYTQIREWVVLAGGVIGATLVVPEFLYDVTGGSLGASGAMLVAGVTLLAGSLAGLRIRRNPDPGPRPAAPVVAPR